METLEKQFKKTMYVGYETSMSPHINREQKVMEYNVGWNKEVERGWFEMYDEDSGVTNTTLQVGYFLTEMN